MTQSASADQLRIARRRLRHHWDRASQSWKGVTAMHFSDHGWLPWEAEADRFEQALAELHESLREVERL